MAESEGRKNGLFGSIGPAIIVAAVVCGPGSILTASKVGATFGYTMTWALALAVILMLGATMLSAHLGVSCKGTPCDELASRLGRPAAVVVGVVVFLIAAGFQTSNNLAVMKALEPYFGKSVQIICIVVLNGFLIAITYISRSLYTPIERAMKLFIGLMVLSFIVNCVATKPDLGAALKGLVPRLPDGEASKASIFALAGLVATTFSVAGAFYQAYLVRDKGWHLQDVKRRRLDSVVGILVLGGITFIIMLTAAAQFHGTEKAENLNSVTDIAQQLTIFGSWGEIIFTVGIFAGALSSFYVNAMIGGRLLADGLGKGRSMDDQAVRHGTVAALVAGIPTALVAGNIAGINPIIVAQACTVLGVPALALTLIYLATRKDLAKKPNAALVALAWVGLAVTLVLAYRTIDKLVSS